MMKEAAAEREIEVSGGKARCLLEKVGRIGFRTKRAARGGQMETGGKIP